MSDPEEKTLMERVAERAASVGARAGIEAFERSKRAANRDLTDKRLRNVKLLLRNYRAFKDHVENAVSESSLEDIHNRHATRGHSFWIQRHTNRALFTTKNRHACHTVYRCDFICKRIIGIFLQIPQICTIKRNINNRCLQRI